jgi:hypothetical protein
LQQVVVEQALVDSIHSTTVAHLLAQASLQPHRSRYWKTARLDEEFLRLAAKVLWGYESVDWLHRRGEVVIGMDEKPNIQALRRVAPTQPMGLGRMERREFEYERKGIVHFLVAFNVYDGTMLGWCLDTNDHDHFLWGVRQVERRSAKARRIHLILDNGGSPIAQDTHRYFARRPRMPRGSIKRSCCCARLPRSTSIALIRSPVSIWLSTSRSVGRNTIAALPIRLNGHGLGAICMPGPRRRAMEFVQKLTLQSTRGWYYNGQQGRRRRVESAPL